MAELDCDVVVLGAGPGGYSAAFRAADLGLKTVLVERYPTLGGVCLNVGCIPSKALLHTAAVMDAARALGAHGISFGEPKVDLDKLRAFKDKVVAKLTGGLAAMAKMRKVTVVQGAGAFSGANQLAVDGKSNEITAVPKLLELLVLRQTIVTVDALNRQRAIAEQIIAQGGEYVLALKGNQGTLFEDVRLALDDPLTPLAGASETDAGHGRIEQRQASLTGDIAWLHERHA